jgi:hypothetical protein
MKAFLIIFLALLAFGFSAGPSPAQKEVKDEKLDSLAASFRGMVRNLTTPALERRKMALRKFQQRGYVEVLSAVVAEDGVSALLSLIKVNAQIAYHLPHNQLVFHIPPAEAAPPATQSPWHLLTSASQPYTVPLVQDWTFPVDPWSDQ